MADQLSEEQIADLKHAFDSLDKDRKGHISTGDLGSIMKSLGQELPEDELQEMIRSIDTDGNGEIDFDEFLELMANKMAGGDEEAELQETFKYFDQGGKGYITRENLKEAMAKMGNNLSEIEVDDMINEADIDGDGTIDYGEFVKMMTGGK